MKNDRKMDPHFTATLNFSLRIFEQKQDCLVLYINKHFELEFEYLTLYSLFVVNLLASNIEAFNS